MVKRSVYSSVSRARKNPAKTVAIVLGIVAALLLVFIIWCVIAFSTGGSAFTSQAEDISTLKIQLAEKDAEINTLKEQVTKLEEENRQLQSGQPTPDPNTTTPPPTETPTPSPTRTPTRTPARTSTSTPTPTPPPASTPTPTPPTPTPPPEQTPEMPQVQDTEGQGQQQVPEQ